jgi:peptide/nickel transport system substrate-binding protein
LYNGPYLITGYQSGSQIVLEPNPHWAGKTPAFKRIVLRSVENTAALQANLLSGDVDMVAGEGVGLTIDQVLALRRQHPDQFDYVFKPSLTYEHIDLKIENPILADLRVRQALLYAIDRKTMVDRLFEGLQPVAATWVNPLEANFSPDAPGYAYDPGRARELLAQAGWQKGADGICRNEAGARLSIEFATTAGNRLRELQQQVLQSQWKAACVETIIRNEPARTLFGQTLKQRLYTGMVMYAWSSSVGGSPRQTLHSSQIPTAANGWSGSNAVAFNDPAMDADIEKAERTLDPAGQKPIWADMQRVYAEKLPVLPLFFRADPHVIPKWLKGYAPTGHSGYTPLWVEEWHPG